MNRTIFDCITEHLQNKGIIITDIKRLEKYITNYNYNRVIKPYTKLFDDKDFKEFNITTDDILNLYELDNKLSMLFLNNILEIEKKLNTLIAYTIEDCLKIYDGCLFKLDKKILQTRVFNCVSDQAVGMSFDQLISKITKYAHINPNTSLYEDKRKNNLFFKWVNCPLDALCLTWTFTTTALTYLSLDNKLKQKIIAAFSVNKNRIKEFNCFIKCILSLRNIITHNNVLINNLSCLNDIELLESFNEIVGGRKQFLNIYDLAIFIQYFSNDNTFYDSIYEIINKYDFNPKLKQAIISMTGAKE